MSQDDKKTKKQLIEELADLRRRAEEAESGHRQSACCIESDITALGGLAYSLDQIQDGLVQLNKLGTIIDVNRAAADIFGGSKDELIGKHFTKIGIFSPKDIPGLLSRFKNLLSDSDHESTLQITNKLGRLVYLENSVSVRRAADGSVCIVAVVRDITERKQAEKKLRESESRFDLVVQATSDGVWEWNILTNEEYFAPRWCEIIGYSHDDPEFPHTYDSWAERIHPDDYEHVMQKMKAHLEEGEIYDVDYRHRHKSGEYRWQNSRGQAILDDHGKPVRMVGCIRDITKRKLAEKEIETIFDMTGYMVCTGDLEGHFTRVNDSFEEILGYTKEELVGKLYVDFIHPEDIGKTTDIIEIEKTDGSKVVAFENRYRCKDGTYKWLSWTSQPDPTTGVAYAIAYDITDRKRAEEALQASEERFRTVMVQSPLVMEIYDLDGLQIEVNRAYEELWEFSADTTVNKFNVLQSKEVEDTGLMDYVKRAYAGEAVTVPEYVFDLTGSTESGGPGRIRWLSTRIYPLKDSSGNVISIVITHEDVTDRRLAEKALKESERRLSFHLQNTPIAAIEWNLDFEVVEWNAAAEKVFGFKREEVLGKHATDLIITESVRESVGSVWNELLENTGGYCNTNENLTKDGRVIICEWRNTPLVDESGKVYGVAALAQDITERKQAEEELLRYKCIVSSSNDMMALLDKNFVYLATNEKYLEPFGLTRSKIIGSTVSEVFGDKFFETIIRPNAEKCLQGNRVSYVDTFDFPMSGERYMEITYDPFFGPDNKIRGFVVNGRDITKRNQTEEELKNVESRSRAWLENSPVCTKVLDLDFNLQFMSTTGIEELKIDDITQFYGKPYPFDFYPDSFRKPMIKNLEKAKETGEVITQEASVVDVEGNELWYHSTIVPVKDDEGRIDYIMVLSIETTKRKRAEMEMKRVSDKLQMSISKMPIAYIMWDKDKTTLEWNEAAEGIFGYTSEEMLGNSLFDAIVPNDGLHLVDQVADKLFAGKPSSYSAKDNNIRKDGELISCMWHNTPLCDANGQVTSILSMVQDVTETKRLEELESRAARLDTAGTIAGQVAHDFNNLLAPLLAYPDFIREELHQNHPALGYLDDIENSAKKIADINQQLLTLGRRGHYNQVTLNVNTIIHQAVKEMTPLADNVTLATDLDPNLMNILGGGSQIHRVITNLLCNAVDALRGIGHINVKTENYYADDVSGTYGRVPTGEYVKLTISDTGCGISDDIIKKILDPFFTTKTSDMKRGSGLGLSVVDAVVKDHGGYLDLETKPGKGTSFYIYFPTTRKSLDSDYSDQTCGGSETILVVDDDYVQRNVSTQLLKKLGYEVNSVESGEKAIEFLRETPHDLVILDMIMPGGLDGAETYRQMLKINPHQKAIIVSGFSESDRVQEAQELGAGAFVMKPLTRKAIAVAVREELDKPVKIVTQ